ncbi:MAG: hypothetical protein QM723_06005 [Myxococcaceae bacterium]
MFALLVTAVLAQTGFSPPPPPPEPPPPSAGVQMPVRDGSGPQVGGVMSPAALPSGASALYAVLGAPNVGAGYRQGFNALEFEAKAMFNYFLASFLLEVGIRIPLYEKGKVQMAPVVAVGFEADSGTRYYDTANFGYLAVRPRLGFVTAIKFADTVSGIISVDFPWAIPVTSSGAHITPQVGAGAEVYVGGKLSLLIMGELGMDAIKMPLGVTQYRGLWGIRLGLGYRLF